MTAQLASPFGLYGKLPAHGDFVQRNLPAAFVSVWDEWLQRCLADSRNQLNESWLDYYLTGAIWRFALGHGAINHQSWIGILMPSVDSVGRYFPMTIALPLSKPLDAFAVLCNHPGFFEALEQAGLDALQQPQDADQLWQQLDRMPVPDFSDCLQNTRLADDGNILVSSAGHSSQTGSSLLYATARMSFASGSLWYASTSRTTDGNFLLSKNLPTPDCYAAMLTHTWP